MESGLSVISAMEVPSEGSTIEASADTPFYKKAASYWAHIPATVDGMLGGFGFVSSIDIQSSSNFLKNLYKSKTPPGKGRALDCGAGIGRISKYLLLERFEKVDLVEQNPAFLEQASTFIGVNKRLGNMFCSGLQNFTPEPNTYDVIWCQWVLSHLTDEDLNTFLQKCQAGLKQNGVIIVKENVTRDGQSEIDETDSSVTRSLSELRTVLESAGLKCLRVHKQERFPRVLYPVYMFALRPLGPTDKVKRVKSDTSSNKSLTSVGAATDNAGATQSSPESTPASCNVVEETARAESTGTPGLCNVVEETARAESTGTPGLCNVIEETAGAQSTGTPGLCDTVEETARAESTGTPGLCNTVEETAGAGSTAELCDMAEDTAGAGSSPGLCDVVEDTVTERLPEQSNLVEETAEITEL